ncbi:hypothetical protein [Streptomyces sp. NPDC048508]|uniref:hypothetical protein n=1 Tax=Streptomyces sp. NPDC048508 TaxID=3365561 RepID=UPI00371FA180
MSGGGIPRLHGHVVGREHRLPGVVARRVGDSRELLNRAMRGRRHVGHHEIDHQRGRQQHQDAPAPPCHPDASPVDSISPEGRRDSIAQPYPTNTEVTAGGRQVWAVVDVEK